MAIRKKKVIKRKKQKENIIERVELHAHDEYSIKDGVGTVEDYVKKAKSMKLKAFTITNHGSIGQWVRQYFSCKCQDTDCKHYNKDTCMKCPGKYIKNIFGCEVYLMFDRDRKLNEIRELNAKSKNKKKDKEISANEIAVKRRELNKRFHLIILAKNEIGFRNLKYLNNEAVVNGFYYEPRVDWDLLKKHKEGLIILTACLGGPIAKTYMDNGYQEAKNMAQELKNVFNDNLYIEIQLHDFEGQPEVNNELIKISKELDIPLVITQDSHYINKEDSEVQDTLMLAKNNNTWKDVQEGKEGIWLFDSKQLWYKNELEIRDEWKRNHNYLSWEDYTEAQNNTIKIADKIEEFSFGENENHILSFTKNPELGKNKLRDELAKGWIKRKIPTKKNHKEYADRLKYELDIVYKKGYEHYFLIVMDYIRDCKREYGEETVGPGRGSGAGSLINYVLGITDIDPLEYGLLFERFLNQYRNDIPDIDTDFHPDVRDYVKGYIISKFGNEHSTTISACGTYQTRSVTEEVGRVYSIPYQEIQSAKNQLMSDSDDMEFEELCELYPKFNDLVENYPIPMGHVAKTLRGQIRNMSRHAAGVVITKNNIMEDIALTRCGENVVSAWVEGATRTELGRIGRVKFDILGLKNLKELKEANDLIEERYGKRINWNNIGEMNDKKVMKVFQNGDTDTLFQFESQQMRELLRNAKVKHMRDLAAISALGRPGPLRGGLADMFCLRSKGKEEWIAETDVEEEILGETYGVITYQEQPMIMMTKIAGMSLEDGDKIRKLLSKIKKETEHLYAEERDKYKKRFIEGGIKNGYNKQYLEQRWSQIEEFSKYGFNKSHAICYGVISYRTGYMYFYYPTEWMTSVLNNTKPDFTKYNKVEYYINTCKRKGIEVKRPLIGYSKTNFSIEEDKVIRFGYSFIKDVGKQASKFLEKLPKDSTLEDLFGPEIKVLNKRSYEPLIKVGVFDELYDNRKILFQAYTKWFENDKDKSIYEYIKALEDKNIDDWDITDKIEFEKEYLNLYISQNPLNLYKDKINEIGAMNLSTIEKEKVKNPILYGKVTRLYEHKAKNGKMAFLTIEDDEGTEISVTIFADSWKLYKSVVKERGIYVFKIKKSKGNYILDTNRDKKAALFSLKDL